MANIASQKKRILRTEREHDENRRFTGAVKTQFRRLEEAVEAGDSDTVAAGDADTVTAEHRTLIARIDKAVQKGALHSNTGARKKARAARIVSGS